MTEAEKKAREEQMAKLLQQMEKFFEDKGDLVTIQDKIKAVESIVNATGDEARFLDRKSVEDRFEMLRAQNERIIRAVASSKRGAYFPGIEDEAKKFCLLKALVAKRTKDWSKAGYEQEVMKTAAEALLKATGQVAGDLDRGGNFIADQLIPDVIGPVYMQSAFIAMDGDGQTRVSVLDGLPGGRITVPQFHGGMIAYWMGEEDDFVASQVKTGDVHMDLRKIGVLARLTDTMIRFASYGFDALLRRDMIKALVKKIDWTIPFGVGSANMPRGIAYWKTGGHKEAGTDDAGNNVGPGVKVFRADTAAPLTYAEAETLGNGSGFVGGEIDFDALSLMSLALEEDNIDVAGPSYATIGCPRYFDRLKRIKVENYSSQTTGRPYLVGIPILPDSRLTDLIGPWARLNQIKSNTAPGAAGSSTAVFGGASATTKFSGLFRGDFSEVIFGRGAGIEIEDDEGKGTGFVSDSTYIKLRMYGDTMVRQPRAIIFCPDVKVRD